jgi:PPOX class probable F420-dependent enzyme
MTVSIPDSHRDLLDKPVHGVLTTMMADGQPQSSIVWCDYDGAVVRVNTTLDRQKTRNIQAEPRVTLLVTDPLDSARWIEIRGTAEITTEGANQHLDKLTREYTDSSQFYGEIVPLELAEKETRVICKIRPHKITLDAIHK